MSRRRAPAVALLLGLACTGGGATAAPLVPSGGALMLEGSLEGVGRYEIRAVLQAGSFTGSARLLLADGRTIEAPLVERQSYLENGTCHLRFEQGRLRGEIHGKCDSRAIDGSFETFVPGQGLATGRSSGTVGLLGGGATTAEPGALPTAKLVCAYQDRRFSAKAGEATQYSLAYSGMGSLQMEGGSYRAGSGGGGSFERVGSDRIRLTSGPWSGAVGSLEPDRSGRPAVVFHVDENRRPDGVHIVDPHTTRCTEARP